MRNLNKKDENITIVEEKIDTICCDGGQDGLGHPAVYFTFDSQNSVICNYCGKTFIKEVKS